MALKMQLRNVDLGPYDCHTMTLHSKVMAKAGFWEFPPCISFEYRKSACHFQDKNLKIEIWAIQT